MALCGTAEGTSAPSNIFEDPEFCETGNGSGSDVEHPPSPPPSDGGSPPPPPQARPKKASKPRKSKAIASDKVKRPTKADMQRLHSTSQRLVRESSVNLPKYQATPRSLDGFLSKLRRAPPPPQSAAASLPQHTTPSPATDKENVSLQSVSRPGEATITDQSTECPTEGDCGTSDTKDDDSSQQSSAKSETSTLTPHPPPIEAEPSSPDCLKPNQQQQQQQQTTIDSLFSPHPFPPPSTTPSPPPPHPEAKPPPPPLPVVAPVVSSVDKYLFARDASVDVTPPRPLGGLDLLQRRFTQHVQRSKRSKVKKVKLESENEEKTEGGGEKGSAGIVAPVIPSDVVEELMDQPGAVRKHWKEVMSQRLSRQRAEERQAAEEVRKMYSEEDLEDGGGALEEEEEAELTDADTTDMDSSDEEFVVAAEDQRRAEQSDHCSDFSDDDNSPRELPEDSTNQLADEGRDTDSDDDDINIISRTAKKKNAAFRRLDSDDEDSTLPEKTVSTHTATEEGRPPFALFGSSSSSSSKTSKVGEHIVAVKRDGASRRFSVLAEEASMGPLLLNDSFSEESEASTSERASPDPPLFKKPGLLPAESGLATLQHEDTCMTMFDSAFPQGADGGTAKTTFTLTESSGLATVQLRDSGLATQETPDQHYDPLPDTLPMEEEEEEEEDTGYLGGGGDDSLESNSIQCGQTTTTAAIPQPPPRKDSSDLFSSSVSTTRKESDELESQWLPTNRTSPEPSQSLDEETQFLDANGFLCIRKQKKHNSPVSAIRDALDPTQPSSATELLALCSGQFTAGTGGGRGEEEEEGGERERNSASRERRRHLSDSSSTQGVRELLGLPIKPKPVGISKLLAASNTSSFSLNFDESQSSAVDNVLELCSGVFPATQQQPLTASATDPVKSSKTHFPLPERGGGGGGMEGEAAILRWAALRQKELGARPSGYETDSEDEDMPVLRKRVIKLQHKPTKGERLAEYVENEAELSGEDVGTDDEAPSSEDEYEEEDEGSDVPLSDSELWDQVNRAHMKEVSAEDKADLKNLKERFLKEGDLYEDGLYLKNGFFRTRKFAHGTGSDAGSLDLFGEEGEGGMGGGEEGEGGDAVLGSQAEAKRRKERVERDEFIRKCRAREGSLLDMHDEDSQSILGIINDTTTTSHSLLGAPQPASSADAPPPPPATTIPRALSQRTRCGSFLRRSSVTLNRLPSSSSSAVGGAATTSSNSSSVAATSRRFVFHKAPDLQKAPDPTPSSSGGSLAAAVGGASKSSKGKPKARKLQPSSSQQPLAKRQKLERSVSTPPNGSIFSILK